MNTNAATTEPEPYDEDKEIVPADQQESEEDVHPQKSAIDQAVLFNTDWTVETLFRQVEKHNINLDPKFQRREAWDADRKSKLIESILCSLPIPNVVLAEDKVAKGRYLVIDGKQRLFSIASYLRGEFELRGLAIRQDLLGKRFLDLSASDTSALENFPIRTIVIRNWPDEDYLYTVFYRLNSGSLPLSPQELRKALHGGILLDYIDDFIKNSSEFKAIFGGRLDPRMRDVELVLRFVAFDRSLEKYGGDLKRFLDGTVQFYDSNWQAEKANLDVTLKRLTNALALAGTVFLDDAFKKWNGTSYERRINRAVFDVISRYFADGEISGVVLTKKAEIVSAFKAICVENEQFRQAIERTTKTPTATRTRYILWGNKLAPLVGKQLDFESMRLL